KSSQCTGGSLVTDANGEANSIPAMDCFLGPMGGPPDGSGSARTFNAAACFGTPATALVVSLGPTSLTFSSQNLNTTSQAQTISLTNTGTAALSISSVALQGTNASAFFQSNNCPIGSNLGINSSCTITITFTPLSAGSLAASIAFTDNASDSPQSAAVSGTGVQSSFSSQSTARI